MKLWQPFAQSPHILQEFRKGTGSNCEYYDFAKQGWCRCRGRSAALSITTLSSMKGAPWRVLATVTPLDKKVIHGMVDAVMAPCSVAG